MNLQLVIVLAGVGVGLYFLSKVLFKADTRVEDRRRRAVKLSRWADKNGLPVLSQCLDCYAVGDYSGLIHGISQLSDIVGDDDQIGPAINKFLQVQLVKKAKTEEGREEVLAVLERELGIKIPREAVKNIVANLEVRAAPVETPLTAAPAEVAQPEE